MREISWWAAWPIPFVANYLYILIRDVYVKSDVSITLTRQSFQWAKLVFYLNGPFKPNISLHKISLFHQNFTRPYARFLSTTPDLISSVNPPRTAWFHFSGPSSFLDITVIGKRIYNVGGLELASRFRIPQWKRSCPLPSHTRGIAIRTACTDHLTLSLFVDTGAPFSGEWL